MATTEVSLSGAAYTLVASSVGVGFMENKETDSIRFVAASSVPSASITAYHLLAPRQQIPFSFIESTNIYAMMMNDASGSITVTVG
jgi:hypothetical protein